jgi:Tol biopolymer transport system component
MIDNSFSHIFTTIINYPLKLSTFSGKISPKAYLLLLMFFLSSCSNYPRLLTFPFSDNTKSFNSRSSELNPHIAGQYITFVSDRNGSQDVYLFDAKNRRLIDLPGLNAINEVALNPSISEDGRYLVFAVATQGKSGLFLYDRTTQQKRPLITEETREIRNPMISSNGEKITFEVANNGQWDIVVTDIRGNPLNNN